MQWQLISDHHNGYAVYQRGDRPLYQVRTLNNLLLECSALRDARHAIALCLRSALLKRDPRRMCAVAR